jgi:hypothetical protein
LPETLQYAIEVIERVLCMREVLAKEEGRTRWEYRNLAYNRHLDYLGKFNQLGAEGWELVSVDYRNDVALFKRVL